MRRKKIHNPKEKLNVKSHLFKRMNSEKKTKTTRDGERIKINNNNLDYMFHMDCGARAQVIFISFHFSVH